MSRHDDEVRLRHMLDHAREAVQMMEGRTLADLQENRMLQLALTRLVEIIGEAASRISDETQAATPELPWPQTIGMGNRLVHGYDRINLRILFDTVEFDLPPLVRALDELLD
jgi:uncharacterized protein with HEPN domain